MVLIPEVDIEPEQVARELRAAYTRGKPHAIVVVAEGAKYNAQALADYYKAHAELTGFELRVTILGHVQRGGSPLAYDRLLASRLGDGAVELLARGEHGKLVGMIKGEVTATPLEEVAGKRKPIDIDLYRLTGILAR